MIGYRCPQEWSEWNDWLAAGLHGRSRWRLSVVLCGLLFAAGRRTVTSWLRAAGVGCGFSNYYYFLASIGQHTEWIARRLLILLVQTLPWQDHLLFALDDTPSKRYGPKVQGAGRHHNPNSGPDQSEFFYGHIWVSLAWIVRHPRWGVIGLPVRALLYIRKQDLGKLPKSLAWKFQTKLQLGAELVAWLAKIFASTGKPLWIVADGAYAMRSFLKATRQTQAVVISRLRKNAALYCLPPKPPPGRRYGAPRRYGSRRIYLARRAAQPRDWKTLQCVQYHRTVTKHYKDFQATYHGAYGQIHVVIVREDSGPQFFFSTDPNMSVREILEAFADRGAIEQDFHDVKEVWGAGQQQVRTVRSNLGAWHLNLWMHSLVELWAWNQPQEQLCDRRLSPWDSAERRPSHADRRKALRRTILRNGYSAVCQSGSIPQEIRLFAEHLIRLAA